MKGSKAAAVADIDGNFTLAGVANGSVIEISYIGLKTQTVTYKGFAIKVTLQEDAAEANEMVVRPLVLSARHVLWVIPQPKSKVTHSLCRVTTTWVMPSPVR